MIGIRSFCKSADARETVADALSTVILDEYGDGTTTNQAHVLRGQHCDTAVWTLHYFFAMDGLARTVPLMSKPGVDVFDANGGVGWHAVLTSLPNVGLKQRKIIEPTYSQFFDLVGLGVEGFAPVAERYPHIYPRERIAVVDADAMPAFAGKIANRAHKIATTQDRAFDVPSHRRTHGKLIGQSPEELAAFYTKIWDMQSYEPVPINRSYPRDRQAQRLAVRMVHMLNRL